MHQEQRRRVADGRGFFAALDQSGGSSPKALAGYGIGADAYATDEEMFDLMHAMRSRVMCSTPFGGDRILGAILFEETIHRLVDDVPTGTFLWERKGVVPFVKIDKGLAEQADGVQLMKPIDGLEATLSDAVASGVFGTKMRSVIHEADERGIAAIVEQQFEVAARVAATGLVPILEPEVSIGAPDKDVAEQLLLDAVTDHLEAVTPELPYMLKITIPSEPTRYAALMQDPRMLRVVALSGGYPRSAACQRLARCHGLIASFSRALLDGLTAQQSDAAFDATLEESISEIYAASGG